MVKAQLGFCCGLIALACAGMSTSAAWSASLKAGDVLHISVSTPQGPVDLTLRYCPVGVCVPGKPRPESVKPQTLGLLSIAGPIDVQSFYLSETEVSLADFAKVMGASSYAQFAERVAKENERFAGDLVQKVKEQAGDCPAFDVTLEEGIEFCRILNRLDPLATQSGEIERRRFRIPSHLEWQYACRADATAKSRHIRPHFALWPADVDALSKTDREKGREEWKEMGHREDEFVASQPQMAEMIESRWRNDNPKPLDVLFSLLKLGIGVERDFSRPAAAVPRLRNDKANAWGFYGMHEGVREWCLSELRSQAIARTFWERLANNTLTAQDRATPSFLLAGGSFVDIMAGDRHAWMKFTIWGGAPFDLKEGEIRPVALADLDKGGSHNSLCAEQMPGLRVLAERSLIDDWLYLVRASSAGDTRDKSWVGQFARWQASVEEIVPPVDQAEKLAILAFYRGIGEYRRGSVGDAGRLLEAAAKATWKAPEQKLTVAELQKVMLDGVSPAGNSTVQEASNSPDQGSYFQLLHELVQADAAASTPN